MACTRGGSRSSRPSLCLDGLLRDSPIERSTAPAADHPTGIRAVADRVPRAVTMDTRTFIEKPHDAPPVARATPAPLPRPGGGTRVIRWALGHGGRCAIRTARIAIDNADRVCRNENCASAGRRNRLKAGRRKTTGSPGLPVTGGMLARSMGRQTLDVSWACRHISGGRDSTGGQTTCRMPSPSGADPARTDRCQPGQPG